MHPEANPYIDQRLREMIPVECARLQESAEVSLTKLQTDSTMTPLVSDHGYQAWHVDRVAADGSIIEMIEYSSYNMQDKCKAPQEGRHGNNPFGIDEDWSTYESRKTQQIEFLADKLAQGDDLCYLQEIDFLAWSLPLAFNDEGCTERLRDLFTRKILCQGFAFQIQENSDCQALAILYRESKFTLDTADGPATSGVFYHKKQKRFRGMKTKLLMRNQNDSLTPVVATNVHFIHDYPYYPQEIEAYQKELEAQGVLGLMAGDTNNVSNESLGSLAFGDWEQATCFHKNKAGNLTIARNPEKGIMQSVDKTMPVAAAKESLQIKLLARSEELEQIDLLLQPETRFRMLPVASHRCERTSVTRIGERLRRGREIVDELAVSYQHEENIDRKVELLLEFENAVALKRPRLPEQSDQLIFGSFQRLQQRLAVDKKFKIDYSSIEMRYFKKLYAYRMVIRYHTRHTLVRAWHSVFPGIQRFDEGALEAFAMRLRYTALRDANPDYEEEEPPALLAEQKAAINTNPKFKEIYDSYYQEKEKASEVAAACKI